MAKILVVDDEPDIVDLLIAMLDPKHSVVGVTSASDALIALAEVEFDLMFTDIRMPSVNGFTLINRAKELRPKLAVVAMSSYYDPSDPATRKIVREYTEIALPKPLDAKTVKAVVDGLVPA